jgi:hypothetical protein
MKKTTILLSLLIFFGTFQLRAGEGMWLPLLLERLNYADMQKMGLQLTPEELYSINHSSLKDAIVGLSNSPNPQGYFCTAEIVSGQGLIFTNHHCGYASVQKHSTVEHDYLKDGFWAFSKDEELPNEGLTASVLVYMSDVTDSIVPVLDTVDEHERISVERKIISKLAKEASEGGRYNVVIKPFFEGNEYYMFVYLVYRDVRLVGAPPSSIGKFGGDTDNWMWPRHTNDFSMFRVYCGPDGKPASYSEDNVPYQPKHFLPISLKGVEEGDFAMIMGYPGRTNRYETSFGVKNTMEVTNTVREEVREQLLKIWGEYMKTSQKARIQYASKYARSSNYYKYSIGQNNGLKNLKVVDKKQAIEKDFTNWVNENSARKEKYGEALKYIEDSYKDTEDDKAIAYLSEALLRGPEIFMFAYRVTGLAELLKEDEPDQEKIAKTTERIKMSLDGFFKDYNAPTDQKVVGKLLKIYADKNAEKFYPDFYKTVNKKYKGDFNKYAEKLFAKTMFDDKDELTAFLDKPSYKTLKKDMAFIAASDIVAKYREISKMVDAGQKNLDKGRRLFLAGLMEMQNNKTFYPDANSTMRLTYGKVLDYNPRDGVTYNYFTTTNGYLEKEIPGDAEFDVPARMKELLLAKDYGQYADKDGSLHTCFITNNDITGGNSGSPVMNGKGELIGIAFDGNWEAMSGDIAFEPELQRCINVDIRFVLWVIDTYAGASNLIDEMDIRK